MKYLPLLTALLLPLASHAEETRYTYRCDNGSQLDIAFLDDANGAALAQLHFADGELTLPQVPTVSGTRYRRDPVDLLIENEEALFSDAQGNRRQCSRAPLSAPSSFLDVSGAVSYFSRTPLPQRSELVVLIQAHGKAGSKPLTLSEQRYRLAGEMGPIPFAATVDRDLLGKNRRLGVSARIEVAGKLRYRGGPSFPEMQQGQPAPIQLELKALAGR